jgi:hypothetical protein
MKHKLKDPKGKEEEKCNIHFSIIISSKRTLHISGYMYT